MQATLTANTMDRLSEHMVVPTLRLHYLDWLRLLAILGVFLYHAVHPFDYTDWHIKNADLSMTITVILVFFSLWGMPFFFLIAGTGTWFALRRRTPRQYIVERSQRLLIPFVAGVILLMPIMLYFEWRHHVRIGEWHNTFWERLLSRTPPISPDFFGWAGYHLWFLGFLFSFSLITLPLFRWLKGESGSQWLARLAHYCERRGAILWFILPLLIVQMLFRPFFPFEHDWADFFVQMSYFALGYILLADPRFAQAIQRDWRIILIMALAALALVLSTMVWGDPFAWSEQPTHPGFYLVWSVVTVSGWCWCLLIFGWGMRTLNFDNSWLDYGKEAILPFFMLHQPVIMVIAYYVVQWDVGIPIKLPVVVIGSLVVSLSIYEYLVRRIALLRNLFGVKSG